MKAFSLTAIVLLLGLFGATPASSQAFEEYSGEETFYRFCASCHGEAGRGNGPVSSAIPIGVPDLTLIRKRHGDDDYAEETLRRIIDGRKAVIYHGTRYMPVWGYEFWVEEGADVVAEQNAREMINRIVSYLESIQTANAAGLPGLEEFEEGPRF